MPAMGRPEETGDDEGATEERLAALERAVGALADEVRTRRLVVVDGDGVPRIVGELSRGTAELRLEVPTGGAAASPSVVLYASPAPSGPVPGDMGLGPAVGLQIWADGDAVAELDAWPEEHGAWGAHLHLEPADGSG